MLPRSILKSIPSSQEGSPQKPQSPCRLKNGHVRFPPQSQLAATYYAHSASIYDRSPLVVAPNECALPRRNCPDRTYVLCDSRGEARLLRHVQQSSGRNSGKSGNTSSTTTSSGGSSASNNPEEEDEDDLVEVPRPSSRSRYTSSLSSSRVPDLTWSESDDSDGLLPPLSNELLSPPYAPYPSYHARSLTTTSESAPHPHPHALAFLPHALPSAHQRRRSPSPRARQQQQMQMQRGRERTSYSTSLDNTEPPPRRPKARSSRPSAFAVDVPPDYGCLGGF